MSCKRCNDTGLVPDGEIPSAFGNEPIRCFKDCPVCKGKRPSGAQADAVAVLREKLSASYNSGALNANGATDAKITLYYDDATKAEAAFEAITDLIDAARSPALSGSPATALGRVPLTEEQIGVLREWSTAPDWPKAYSEHYMQEYLCEIVAALSAADGEVEGAKG
jgi:hypothetical protein